MHTLIYDRIRRQYDIILDFKDTKTIIQFSSRDNTDGVAWLMKRLSELRVTHVYCWDAAKLFADFDNYAMRTGLADYDAVAPADGRGYRPRVVEECYSVRDGDQAYYSRRYWLKTANATTGDRHKRLHGVTLVNAQNYFGGRDLEEILNTFTAADLGEVLEKFNDRINQLTGLNIFEPVTEKPQFLTLGAISKAFYLSLKYPNIPRNKRVEAYQKDHPADKRIETELRVANLLTGGIIYLKDTCTHYDLHKYDKVSLFPSVEQCIDALGIPVEMDLDEWDGKPLSNEFEYIFLFKSLTLKRREDMPALYPPQEGYTGENFDIITVENEAIFGELYFEYLNFYDVVDSEILKIYRCHRIADPAIIEFVNVLFNEKNTATDPAYYFIIKLILNNLHGKFAQNPITPTYARRQTGTGEIERTQTGIKDNWVRGHFDFIRGAYIYAKARAKMLHDLAEISKIQKHIHGDKYRLVDHLYYSDTDSAILDHEMPASYVGNALGYFKNEGYIEKFHAYAPKIYAYVNEPVNIRVLKCAGAKADEILKFWLEAANQIDGLYSGYDLISFLYEIEELPITTLHRTPTGAEYRTEWRPLTRYGEYDEEGGEL